MPDSPNVAKGLRERLGGNSEDRLGKALSDLLESPLLAGAVGRAFDAREKATQAQEVAFGALNIPSAADIERLTRRLRSVSHRLEGIEDGVDRLDRALAPSGVEARLSAIEGQLRTLTARIDEAFKAVARGAGAPAKPAPAPAAKPAASAKLAPSAKPAVSAKPAASAKPATAAKPAAAAKPASAAKPAAGKAVARTATKRAGARKAEQAKRTAAATAAKRAATARGQRAGSPSAGTRPGA